LWKLVARLGKEREARELLQPIEASDQLLLSVTSAG